MITTKRKGYKQQDYRGKKSKKYLTSQSKKRGKKKYEIGQVENNQ